jgi:uncharacterized repeat protein (TIGR04076 family)
MEPYDVRITVVKTMSLKDVFEPSPPMITADAGSICPRLKKGDTFVSHEGMCPQGFCGWAFADIQRDVSHIRFGGSYPWMQEEGVAYSCCTDGLWPVIFRLERTE